MKDYKSDSGRLARLFLNSRDLWKKRSNENQKQLKLKNNKIRDLTKSRDNWKEKSMRYKEKLRETSKELEKFKKKNRLKQKSVIEIPPDTHAVNHSFPLYLVCLSVLSFIKNGISLRGTSNTFDLFSQYFHNRVPSHSSIRKWVYRTGLHLLRSPIEMTSKMTWILDHSIELGSEKLLVVIAIPVDRMMKKKNFAPDFEDAKLLDLDVCTRSNGEIVGAKMEELADKFGNPAQILIDGGSDLVKGTGLFLEDKPDIVHTYDIPHKLAVLVKKELNDDDVWNEFVEASTMTAKMVRQTDFVFAAPPGLRSKARYMNAELLIIWANKILRYLKEGDFSLLSNSYILDKSILQRHSGELGIEGAQAIAPLFGRLFVGKDNFISGLRHSIGEEAFKACGDKIVRYSVDRRLDFEMKFDWVNEFKSELPEFTQIMGIVETAKQEVRQNGLHTQTADNFDDRFQPNIHLTSRALSFKEKVVEALREESAKIPNGSSLLGSSEIIESIIGKYKTISSKRPIKTLGEAILSIPLSLSRITPNVIKQALESTSYKSVENWSEKKFGQSVLSKRITAFGKTTQFKDELFSFSTA